MEYESIKLSSEEEVLVVCFRHRPWLCIPSWKQTKRKLYIKLHTMWTMHGMWCTVYASSYQVKRRSLVVWFTVSLGKTTREEKDKWRYSDNGITECSGVGNTIHNKLKKSHSMKHIQVILLRLTLRVCALARYTFLLRVYQLPPFRQLGSIGFTSYGNYRCQVGCYNLILHW